MKLSERIKQTAEHFKGTVQARILLEYASEVEKLEFRRDTPDALVVVDADIDTTIAKLRILFKARARMTRGHHYAG